MVGVVNWEDLVDSEFDGTSREFIFDQLARFHGFREVAGSHCGYF